MKYLKDFKKEELGELKAFFYSPAYRLFVKALEKNLETRDSNLLSKTESSQSNLDIHKILFTEIGIRKAFAKIELLRKDIELALEEMNR